MHIFCLLRPMNVLQDSNRTRSVFVETHQFDCCYGPQDFSKVEAKARPADPSRRRGKGELGGSVKTGCKSNFTVKTLAAPYEDVLCICFPTDGDTHEILRHNNHPNNNHSEVSAIVRPALTGTLHLFDFMCHCNCNAMSVLI